MHSPKPAEHAACPCPATSTEAISRRLVHDAPERWTGPPVYADYSRSDVTDRIDQVHAAIRAESDATAEQVAAAYDATMRFVDESFDAYETGSFRDLHGVGRAYVVSMRVNRHSPADASDGMQFAPLLNPTFGVSPTIAQRSLVGLPPAVIETCTQAADRHRQGVVVLAPIFVDRVADLAGATTLSERRRMTELVGQRVADSLRFATDTLGADVIGLGATLPALTRFGRRVADTGGVLTTGHGGTVHLIKEVACRTAEAQPTGDPVIGILGAAGSIGTAALDLLHDEFPHQTIAVFDRDSSRLRALVRSRSVTRSLYVAGSVSDLLRTASVIVSTVTSSVRVDPELDLSGTVIIDNGPPGTFSRDAVAAQGGELHWAAGADTSPDRFLHHDGGGGYTYGSRCGMLTTADALGCEAEAAVIAADQAYHVALREPVSVTTARAIGRLMDDHGVRPAIPRSPGKAVRDDHTRCAARTA